MQIVQIVPICICAAVICASVRTQRPEMATVISLAVGVFVILMLCRDINEIKQPLEKIGALMKLDKTLFVSVLKAAGIAIISEMGAQICSDAGEKALGDRIALASRVSMLCLCLPMLGKLLDTLGISGG